MTLFFIWVLGGLGILFQAGNQKFGLNLGKSYNPTNFLRESRGTMVYIRGFFCKKPKFPRKNRRENQYFAPTEN